MIDAKSTVGADVKYILQPQKSRACWPQVVATMNADVKGEPSARKNQKETFWWKICDLFLGRSHVKALLAASE
jgi:hypothetical protein